ncbi:MAG TPA: AEC family transporter [Dongiaceae bacterium]|nr:AEC family transporter [Dongiaceae bacterium]
MGAILNVVLPVFAIVLAGYLGGRTKLLGEPSSEALNRFVYYVALPALFFVSMARVPVAAIFNWPFLAAYCGGVVATAGLAVAVARLVFPNRLAALGLHGLSATFANTGYMGIPLLVTAFGEVAALPAIIATVLNGAVVMAIGIMIVELDLSRGGGAASIVADVARGVARSPLVLSALAGIAVSSLGLPLPPALATFCDLLGAAAPPCALFAIGLFMVGRSITAGAGEIAWVVALKLVAQPLVTWGLAIPLLGMDRLWAASAVTLAALPTGTLVFVLAQQYGIYTQRATAAILVSTVLSVVTLSALFAWLGTG